MPLGRLVLLLLLIAVVAVVVVVVLRRSSARRDEQRAEAAGIRGEAQVMAAAVTGQDAFAQQAQERAEVARAEADERAREAARLEAEAAEQRAAAEATRSEYEATMRRADDVDPDVKESAFAPVPAHLTRDAGAAPAAIDPAPLSPADPGSRRIASAADFRDDVDADAPADRAGTAAAMSEEHAPADASDDADDDLTRDAESPRGEWGGPPGENDGDPVDGTTTDELADESDASAADLAEEGSQERDDTTPAHDWAADEGELLEQAHERGEVLAQEREELTAGAGDATASDDARDATASDGAGDATASDGAGDATAAADDAVDQAVGRRVSHFQELRDGGFGVGSAAPIEDGAQPLDHPVQAYRDTMTFCAPGDVTYDSADPDVWFYDEGAAERSGFRRAGA